jgi:hypothetical protein
MRLLFDECTPKRLTKDFPGHHIQTVTDASVDQGLRFQQNLSQFNLAVIILLAKPCRYPQLKILVPKVLKALKTIRPGDCVVVQRLSIVT